MQQFFIGIILLLGFTTYFLFNENKTLASNNLALEGAIASQEEAIASIQADFELQTQQMNDLALKSQNYELASKILADPIEMERKINNGTKHIMEDIEKLSSTVDSLDNGLQLQSDSD